MTRERVVTSPLTRALVVVALAALTLLALAGARAAAVPATQTWTGQAAGTTPDILQGGVTILGAGGAPIAAGAEAGTLNFTLDGVPYVGYCIDTARQFSLGTEAVDALTENPPSTANRRALAWLLLNRAPTGPVTPDKVSAASAAQVAAWVLEDPQISPTTPTSDATLNAAALALVQEALAATATPSSLGLSVAAPAAGASTATVTVTGKPGAVVTLSVTSGPGTLSTGSVTIGAGGSATATLTKTGNGAVTVAASTAGDGSLIIIRPTDPTTEPQPTAAARPSTLSASAQATFSPAQTPVTPVVPLKLTISKSAPARSTVLKRVRYSITVRNPAKAAVRNVVLRDRVPRGMSFVRASRASSQSNGTVTFRLGTLAAGSSRTVQVWMIANANVRGTRTNVATVQGTGVQPVNARARTLFVALQQRRVIPVTG